MIRIPIPDEVVCKRGCRASPTRLVLSKLQISVDDHDPDLVAIDAVQDYIRIEVSWECAACGWVSKYREIHTRQEEEA